MPPSPILCFDARGHARSYWSWRRLRGGGSGCRHSSSSGSSGYRFIDHGNSAAAGARRCRCVSCLVERPAAATAAASASLRPRCGSCGGRFGGSQGGQRRPVRWPASALVSSEVSRQTWLLPTHASAPPAIPHASEVNREGARGSQRVAGRFASRSGVLLSVYHENAISAARAPALRTPKERKSR